VHKKSEIKRIGIKIKIPNKKRTIVYFLGEQREKEKKCPSAMNQPLVVYTHCTKCKRTWS